MKRAILIGLAVVVVVAAGAVYYVLSSLEGIVKAAVEEVGSEVTGTQVTLTGVNITLLGGKGTLRGFLMTNPHGFAEGEAFKFDEVSVTVDPTTIFDDPVVIEEILIVGARVNYAIGETTSNIEAIQGNVDSYMGKDDGGSGEGGSGSGGEGGGEDGPNFLIQNVYFHDGKVSVSVPGLVDEGIGTDLPNIHLTDIGKDGKGATPAETAEKIVDAVIDAALGAVATLDLDAVLKDIEDVAIEVEGALDEAAREAEGAAGEAGGIIDEVAAEAEGVVDEAAAEAEDAAGEAGTIIDDAASEAEKAIDKLLE
jgi:hypothetical protein